MPRPTADQARGDSRRMSVAQARSNLLLGWRESLAVAALMCLALFPSRAAALVYEPPAGTSMWDTWMFCEGDEAHLFYLRSEVGKRWNSIGHAVSKDMVHWQELPPIPTQGPEGSWDHAPTLTGCTVKHGDTYDLFYGAANRSQQIGLMTSTNLIDWEKCPGNPVSESGGPHYGDGFDWRDLSAFYDAGQKQWHGVLCARARSDGADAAGVPNQRPDAKHGQPAIGHLVSSDLIHWEQRPPLFTSWRWGNLEVPIPFTLNGRHYLLFSHGGALPDTSGRKRAGGTFYLMADTFEGPYRVPEEPLLLGWGRDQLDNYVGRVVMHQGELLLYHHTCGGPVKDGPGSAWLPRVGGPVTLGAPKSVQQRADGTLWLKYCERLATLEQAVRFDGPPPGGQGEGKVSWLPARVEDASIRIRFRVDGQPSQIGILWRWNGKQGGASWLQTGENGGTVVIGTAHAAAGAMPTLKADDEIRCGPVAAGDHELRVLVRSHRVEVYLDDRWLFATPTPTDGAPGEIGVFASGIAAFRHVRVAELSPLRPATAAAASPPEHSAAPRGGEPESPHDRSGQSDGESVLRELVPAESPATDPLTPLLHGLFADGMVLQRDREVPIWGWGHADNLNWAALRAAQARVPGMVEGTSMACLIDAGMRHEIHPVRKDVAGKRLALVALKNVYGSPVGAHGPVVRRVTKKDGALELAFDHTDGGLCAKRVDLDGFVVPGRAVTGFKIRGRDSPWVEGTAHIEGDKVIVSSPRIADPVAVRYAWADFPLANLYNGEDLPAAPFESSLTTDVP